VQIQDSSAYVAIILYSLMFIAISIFSIWIAYRMPPSVKRDRYVLALFACSALVVLVLRVFTHVPASDELFSTCVEILSATVVSYVSLYVALQSEQEEVKPESTEEMRKWIDIVAVADGSKKHYYVGPAPGLRGWIIKAAAFITFIATLVSGVEAGRNLCTSSKPASMTTTAAQKCKLP